MATPNGHGGWDLTDEDLAEIFAVNWGTTPGGKPIEEPPRELTDPDREDDRGQG